MNPLNPKKLLLSKWTAVTPVAKQKHFLVSKVIKPDLPTAPIEWVEIESVFSKATRFISWRELQDRVSLTRYACSYNLAISTSEKNYYVQNYFCPDNFFFTLSASFCL